MAFGFGFGFGFSCSFLRQHKRLTNYGTRTAKARTRLQEVPVRIMVPMMWFLPRSSVRSQHNGEFKKKKH
eukprot:scaffold130646_cov43-Attheya_sp.AAC.2